MKVPKNSASAQSLEDEQAAATGRDLNQYSGLSNEHQSTLKERQALPILAQEVIPMVE